MASKGNQNYRVYLCVHPKIPDSVSNKEVIEAGSAGVISSVLCIADLNSLSRRSVLLHITICYHSFTLNSVGRLDPFSVLVPFSPHTFDILPPRFDQKMSLKIHSHYVDHDTANYHTKISWKTKKNAGNVENRLNKKTLYAAQTNLNRSSADSLWFVCDHKSTQFYHSVGFIPMNPNSGQIKALCKI